MNADDLEFLIAQYADGTLDPRRSAEVELVLRRDSAAREMLESYRSMDAALAGVAGAQPAPEVRWDRLQDRISRQLSAVAGPAIFSEEVESQLAGFADGSLAQAEVRLITARLEADPQARLVAGEYASIERGFESLRADRPNVRWDALADHLCGVVTGTQAQSRATDSAEPFKINSFRQAATPVRQQAEPVKESVLGRIGFAARWMAQPRRMAIAACLLIGASVSIRLMSGSNSNPQNPNIPAVTPEDEGTPIAKSGKSTIIVNPGQSVETPDNGVAKVQIGGPANGTDRGGPTPGGLGDAPTARGGRSVSGTPDPAHPPKKNEGDAASAFK